MWRRLLIITTPRTRAEEALKRILASGERQWTPTKGEHFQNLIRTILSQNTSWRNEQIAYQRLEEMVGVSPRALVEADVDLIAEAIRPAGMYRLRSRTLKDISSEVQTRYDGDLSKVVSLPYSEAREELMSLTGVGEKTADVVLLFSAGKTVLPVDRHIARISKRLELVPQKAGYDDIRLALENATDPKNYLSAHILLIQFGRETCRAQSPRCQRCILNDICPYPKKNFSNTSHSSIVLRMKTGGRKQPW